MPPRTRQTRAAAKKQQQYRIDDGSDEENSKEDSKKVGGVLAAISQNVPSVQPSLMTKDSPPVSSVEIKSFKKPAMSPLAASHSVRGRGRSRKAAFTDDISAISCDLATKNSVVSEEDDDQTQEMEMPEEVENPYISDAENDADDYDDAECESEGESEQDSEEESEEESEVESEIEEEEEEEFAPDDDDYVPEEDDDSVLSEDEDALENFTEQEPEYQTPIKRKSSKSKKLVPESPVDASVVQREENISNNLNCEDINTAFVDESAPLQDASFDSGNDDHVEELDDGLVSEATEVEPTPMKKTQIPQLNLFSPEPQVAVVLDDDEDFDDDVLVATIVEDDIMENSTPIVDTKGSVLAPIDTAMHKTENQSLHVTDNAKRDKQTPTTVRDNDIKQEAAVDKENMAPKQRKTRDGKVIRGEGLVKRGKWTLGTKIGVGSFGSVHVGMNNATGKLMAVKLFKLDGAVMKDIRTEVELMRSLDHPNIVRYLGAQMDDNNLHIFQEWVPGGSVATLLSRFGPFSLPVIRSYLLQTLQGLLYLHNNNIMHRDIKGSNILVNDEGVVKLADFGASKRLANLGANLMMSLTVRGTPYFMAPEVFEEKYSSKADVWGVGCVAYQMITGSPPWKDCGFTNPISLFNHIKQHHGPPPTGEADVSRLSSENHTVWANLKDLLNMCFAKDPNARPTVDKLLHHKFFDDMPSDTDDESTFSQGLFSPTNVPAASKRGFKSPAPMPRKPEWTSPSPAHRPSPQSTGKSKSVVKWKQTFLSPPRSGRKQEQKSPSPWRPSPTCSPQPEPSEWPEWARAELQKRNLFAESSPEANMQRVSAMMGSLALSESGGMSANNTRGPTGRQSTIGTTATSNLVGLRFLEETSPPVEI